MSRSYKKHPVAGNTCAESEKDDKRHAHHALRTNFRKSVTSGSLDDDFLFDERNRAHSEVMSYAKDGKFRKDIRLTHIGRAVKALTDPRINLREVHKLVSK